MNLFIQSFHSYTCLDIQLDDIVLDIFITGLVKKDFRVRGLQLAEVLTC